MGKQKQLQGRVQVAFVRGGIDSSGGYRRVTIWVSHSEAIVAVFAGNFPDAWMAVYGDGPRPKRMGNWLVQRVESRHHENPRDLHEEIARHLTPADAVLVLGQGRPKHQLARYLADEGGRHGRIAHLDTVANPTEAELLARAESFFGADTVR